MSLLLFLYTFASLIHFVHNAEFIAFYPGLPASMTRESVYLAWLGVGAMGLLALVAQRAGCLKLSAGLLVVYGLLGVDGLLHYTLALCTEHSVATNASIWAEVVLGLVLACAAAVRLHRLAGRAAPIGP